MERQPRRGTVGSGVDGFGTKGAGMNQVMINAVELDLLMKQIDDLKVENTLLKKQLADAHDRIRVLKEDVGFAERGYTKVNNS
jgi:hypothetical protein